MGKVVTSILGVVVLFHSLSADITIESYNTDVYKNKTPEAIIAEDLRNITSNPNVVVWGIGSGGLTDRSLDFYQDFVLTPLKEQFGAESRCYFYDLSAWDTSTWRNKANRPSATFSKKYADAGELRAYFENNEFSAEVLFGADLFSWMHTFSAEAKAYTIETILPQEFLWEKSKDRKATGTVVKRTALGASGSIFSGYGNMRIDYIYSPLQYLEAIFIVDYLIQKGVSEITLFLPNTEFDYYIGINGENLPEFQRDMNKMIEMIRGEINSEVKVIFLPFKYGTRDNDRPYLFRKGLDRCVKWN